MSCSYCVTAYAVGDGATYCPCDDAPELDECEECGAVVGYFGTLGNRHHYQCRNCGASYAREVVGCG